MKDTECDEITELLFATMPTLMDMLAKSPDRELTIRQLVKPIRELEAIECRQVIDDWCTGKLPMPQYRDFHRITIIIRETVFSRRDKVRERERAESWRQKTRPANWQPMIAEVFPGESIIKRAPSEPTAEDLNKNRQAYGGSQ